MKIATNFYSFSECSEFVLMIIPDSPELPLYKQKDLSNCMISLSYPYCRTRALSNSLIPY